MATIRFPEDGFQRSTSCPTLVKRRQPATKMVAHMLVADSTQAVDSTARYSTGVWDFPELPSASRRRLRAEAAARSPGLEPIFSPSSAVMKAGTYRLREAHLGYWQAALRNEAEEFSAHGALGGSRRQSQADIAEQGRSVPPVLPALAAALKSEEVANYTLAKCPVLKKFPPEQIAKIVPVLCNLLGSSEEAAYALSVKAKQLLVVEQAKHIKDTMQTIADCMWSMSEAQWIVTQNMAPPSIQVTARPMTHEAVVGEYTRLKGTKVDEHPVYKKPAISMKKKFGEKAQDMYLMYNKNGAGGSGCWEFTTNFERARPRKLMRTPSKSEISRVSASTAKTGKQAGGAAAGGAASCYGYTWGYSMSRRMSPDQAFDWHFPAEQEGEWSPDTFTTVVDAGAPRPMALLAIPAQQVRHSFNSLKEVMGPFWTVAREDGYPKGDARFVGCMRRGDPLHHDGQGRVESLGNFRSEDGFCYIKTSSSSTSPLNLLAWEPISVVLMYIGHATVPPPAPAEEEPPADPKAKKKGSKEEPPPVEADQGEEDDAVRYPHREPLRNAGWHVLEDSDRENLRLPELGGVPAVEDVFFCEFGRGRAQIPFTVGPTGPPLVFVRSQMSAHNCRDIPCQTVKIKRNQDLFKAALHPQGSEAAAEEPASPEGEELPPPLPPKLASGGQLSYEGYSFFRLPAEDLSSGCDQGRKMLRLETADRARLVVAWFPNLRRRPGSADEGSEPEAGDGESANSNESPRTSPPPAVVLPPPSWVRKEGWRPVDMKVKPFATNESGDRVFAEYLFSRDFEPGQIIISGSGCGLDAMTPVVFWRRLGDPRPNHVKGLLLEEPCMFASGEGIDLVRRTLRAELGDEWAHRTIAERQAEWPALAQECNEAAIQSWVFKRKVECFARELKIEVSEMVDLMRQDRELATVRLPALEERWRALQKALGYSSMPGQATHSLVIVSKKPSLLRAQPHAFKLAIDALCQVFDLRTACNLCVERPELLLFSDEVNRLWSKLKEYYPEVWQERIVDSREGEWPRWASFIGKPREAVAAWLGRIDAEETHAKCCRRVQSFGLPNDTEQELDQTQWG